MLKAMYEKIWDSIVGICSIFTFLGTNDTDSLDYVSKKLGRTTVKVDTRSYNRGSSQGGGGGSDSENYIQRDLLAPDEIKQAVKPKGTTKRYGGSGKTVTEWCGEQELSVKTFYYRLRKVREAAFESKEKHEIVPIPTTFPQNELCLIKISGNGISVELPENVSPETIDIILQGLKSC